VGQGKDNLPISSLRLFLQTAGTRWIPVVRKGWPKRGGWRLFHYDQTEDCETAARRCKYLSTALGRSKSSLGKIQNVGSKNEVRESYTKRILLSIDKNATSDKNPTWPRRLLASTFSAKTLPDK
jgi:hypothetical protein